jgi:hypothetical protein
VSYKVEQCYVRFGGRVLHFVSYDHEPANERRGLAAVPPMWYLMGPAKRWPVMPQVPGQSAEELEAALRLWVVAQGLDVEPPPPPAAGRRARRATHK